MFKVMFQTVLLQINYKMLTKKNFANFPDLTAFVIPDVVENAADDFLRCHGPVSILCRTGTGTPVLPPDRLIPCQLGFGM